MTKRRKIVYNLIRLITVIHMSAIQDPSYDPLCLQGVTYDHFGINDCRIFVKTDLVRIVGIDCIGLVIPHRLNPHTSVVSLLT